MEQGVGMIGRALVVVVDDHGDEDHSGPLVTELLTEAGFVVDGVIAVASDEVDIRNALNTAVIGGVDLVVSVGGTGVTPRDVTPESTLDILDRLVARDRRSHPRVGSVGGHHRGGPVPRPGRHLGQHAGGQPRRFAASGARRHGHPQSAGGQYHRSALQPGDLTPGMTRPAGDDREVPPQTSADERDPDASRDVDAHEQWLRDNAPPHHI